MPEDRSDKLAPDQIGVKNIKTEELRPNPHNPRRLFDKVPLQTLKASIEKVGILVPLTVYWAAKQKSYVILDGQRRWMCAKELRLEEVPVNVVAEPTLVQNIVTMFQIHKLREDWDLMPTALKLEILMKKLEERNQRKLAELTGLDQAVVSRCKKLLDYARRYQDRMLDPNPSARVKADFFIELYAVRNDRFVNSMAWFDKDTFTDRMLEKYEKRKGLKAVTDFRHIKQHITNARNASREDEITKRLQEFTFDDNLGLGHLAIHSAAITLSAKKLGGELRKLEEQVRELDVNTYYGEEGLWKALERLMRLIQKKLQEAGRRIEK